MTTVRGIQTLQHTPAEEGSVKGDGRQIPDELGSRGSSAVGPANCRLPIRTLHLGGRAMSMDERVFVGPSVALPNMSRVAIGRQRIVRTADPGGFAVAPRTRRDVDSRRSPAVLAIRRGLGRKARERPLRND